MNDEEIAEYDELKNVYAMCKSFVKKCECHLQHDERKRKYYYRWIEDEPKEKDDYIDALRHSLLMVMFYFGHRAYVKYDCIVSQLLEKTLHEYLKYEPSLHDMVCFIELEILGEDKEK